MGEAAARLEEAHPDDVGEALPGFGLKPLLSFSEAVMTNDEIRQRKTCTSVGNYIECESK